MVYKKPPQSLLRQLFPWVEEEREKLKERQAANQHASDFALSAFLSCLEWFREVILQDAAVLSLRADWSEFQFFPTCATFASAEFHKFAAELAKSMKTADSESERQPAQLPKQLGAGVKNALVDFKSDAERRDEEMHKKLDLCIELILRQANTIPTLNTSTTPAAHFIDTLPSIASASSFSITADPQNPTPLRASALVGTPALLPLQIQAATPSSPSLSLLPPPNSTSLPANTPSLLSLPLATVPSPRAPSAAPPSFDISGSSDRALTYLNRIMAPASQQTALAPAFIAHLPETTALTSATAGTGKRPDTAADFGADGEGRSTMGKGEGSRQRALGICRREEHHFAKIPVPARPVCTGHVGGIQCGGKWAIRNQDDGRDVGNGLAVRTGNEAGVEPTKEGDRSPGGHHPITTELDARARDKIHGGLLWGLYGTGTL
ncbi:unnamed protein product [Tilletia controversa]|nr:unnamed protein product [Tilletia controversa]